ncbi:uncharacterized protein LOC113295422 [Papaver somniferum]|uniref:uncharacterized protein LOC113295422 n=1 Tax=Papaver somniferum TaxID=3469 RepID=UPI000E6F8F27|nr:uncharacterized protein LOC113295422 [Papaver somniferum]
MGEGEPSYVLDLDQNTRILNESGQHNNQGIMISDSRDQHDSSVYDTLDQGAGNQMNLLKSYLAMGEFDVSMDDFNAQNIDLENLHNSRTFKEPIQSLIRHFEMNQSSHYSTSLNEDSSENTHFALEDHPQTPNSYQSYHGTVAEHNHSKTFRGKNLSAADQGIKNSQVTHNPNTTLQGGGGGGGDFNEKTNISHILFGIDGSVKTWENRRHYTELWWKQNITRGYIWLDEKPDSWLIESPPYKVSENSSNFGSNSAVRIARIVLESFKLGLKNVRWFVLGDDDTIFFTENLISVLSKYDHNQMYYIGGNSESVEQDVLHSYNMAFGGGGFAISYRLAFELARNLDDCINSYPNLYGSDERISSCIADIGVPLTREVGFHQIDVRGDTYGLLAAHPVAPLVSLHHLDFVEPLFPNKTRLDSIKRLMDAHNMDPSRTLQQSVCYDFKRNWSVSVSWGYTVQIYPSLLSVKELCTPLQTFRTWRTWSEDMFMFNVRPIKDDPCESPLVYLLGRVNEIGGQVETLSTYKSYFDETRMKCDHPKYVAAMNRTKKLVTASRMENNEWLKACAAQLGPWSSSSSSSNRCAAASIAEQNDINYTSMLARGKDARTMMQICNDVCGAADADADAKMLKTTDADALKWNEMQMQMLRCKSIGQTCNDEME